MEWIGDLERAIATNLYPLRVPIAIGVVLALVAAIYVARRRGWFSAARRHPARTSALVLVLLAVGGPVGWYLGSPLFIRTSLVEPAPSIAARAVPAVTPAPIATAHATSAPTAVPLGPERTGQFTGRDEFHFGSGTARLIETEPGVWILRFEDFSVRNGPNLYVYLSRDAEGYTKDALELGTLKATDGSFNYDVPTGTETSELRSVVIWCKQFAVQFAVAPLS